MRETTPDGSSTPRNSPRTGPNDVTGARRSPNPRLLLYKSRRDCFHRPFQKMMRKCVLLLRCGYANGATMMSDHPVSAACPAFTIQDCFLETAFEVRFQGLLRSAWEARTWHVIAALPGSGKSLGIADLTHQSNSHKNPRRGTHIPVLVIRAPKNGGKDLAMGMALCAADRALSLPCPGMYAVPGSFMPWLKRKYSASSLMMPRT